MQSEGVATYNNGSSSRNRRNETGDEGTSFTPAGLKVERLKLPEGVCVGGVGAGGGGVGGRADVVLRHRPTGGKVTSSFGLHILMRPANTTNIGISLATPSAHYTTLDYTTTIYYYYTTS